MVKPIDHTIPDGAWRFDDGVTAVFDDMLARSIPQYDVMRQTVFDLAAIYRRPHLDIVDLGASRGEAIAPLVDAFGESNHYTLVETSEPMLTAARQRFVELVDRGALRVASMDLRSDFPDVRACVVLSVLTLMFVPLEYRQRVVQRAYNCLEPGGALILVEKVLAETSDLQATFDSRYLLLKAEHGYSTEEIERKKLSLEGVLVPLTATWNEELLRAAGFKQVDCFWRWCSFAGWLAVK